MKLLDMYDIVNYEKWGMLLKTWAEKPASRPPEGPIVELEKAMNLAGVGVSFAGRNYKSFKFQENPTTDDVLVIVMPPIQVIQEVEAELNNNDYQFPKFYKDLFGELAVPEAQRKTFHTQRIAEYVMRWCG